MLKSFKKAFQPGAGDVHVNRPLTNISVAYMQSAEAFIADQVFPNIPVSNQSDQYFDYDRGEFNRSQMAKRAPATESPTADYKVGTRTYVCDVYSLARDIPDQIRANQDNPIQLDREATEFLSLQAMLNKELIFASSFLTTGVWTFSADGVSSSATARGSLDLTANANNNILHWNDANSNPIEDMRIFKRIMLQNTGFMPNILVLGRVVFDTLLDHPDIIGRLDRGQTSGPAMADQVALAALFGVERILVMDAIQNEAAEGLSNDHDFINGKNGLLCYRPASPGIMTPSAGYTFGWSGYLGASVLGSRVSRMRMDLRKADRVEIEQAFDMRVIGADLGVYLNGIVA